MEVNCALILTFVSLVSATPYGYGVKTGAAAKAEAGAFSGGSSGLNGLPITIPAGSGYSGSFSKASSYASSSASSSSSSFSFNGGGQGTGCSGGCQNNGDKTNDQHGSAPNSFGGASAGAYAGAAAESAGHSKNEGPCSGNDCRVKNDANKCVSGQCGSAGTFESNDISVDKRGAKPTGYSGTECAEGNCDQVSTIATGNAYTNSQNKAAEATSTAPAYASTASYLTTPKLAPSNRPSSYNVPIQSVYETITNGKPSTCTYGNCGNEDSPSSDINITQNKPCTSPNCGNNKPSTYLEAPAYNNKQLCTGDSCGNTDIGPIPLFPSSSPRAPHMPSYGSAPITQLTGPYGLAPSNNPSNPGSYPPAVPTGPACGAGGNCGGQPNHPTILSTSSASASTDTKKIPPYTGSFGGPPGILKPNDFNLPSNTNYNPGSSAPCVSGKCNHQPNYSGPSAQPTADIPAGTIPTGSIYYPQKESSSGSNEQSPLPCFLGNCDQTTSVTGQPSGPSAGYKPTGPLIYPSNPSGPSGGYKPTEPVKYPTGQPTAPSGSYKPIGPVTYPSEQPIKPTGSHKPSGSTTFPIGQPSAPSGNPGSYQPAGPVTYPTGQPIGPSGYNPAAPVNYPSGTSNIPSGTYQPTAPNQIPCFLGNCDQKPTVNYPPTGSYTSTGQDSPKPCSSGDCNQGSLSGPLVPSYVPSATAGSYKPTGPAQIPCFLGNCKQDIPKPTGINDVQCSSGNCNSATGPTSSAIPNYEVLNTPSSSYKPSGPSSTPCFSGNCNQGNVPDVTGSCSSGNCNNAASSSVGASQPGYGPIKTPSGHYKPSNPVACSSGNCNQGGHTGSTSTASASAQAGAVYSGGFGGPPGLLKPYDDGKLVAPIGKQISHLDAKDHSTSTYSSKTGTQSGALANASAGTGSGSYGAQNGESGTGKHSGCNNGCGGGNNDGAGSNYATASAGAIASAKSFAHSGAFASSSASAHAGAQTKSGYAGR